MMTPAIASAIITIAFSVAACLVLSFAGVPLF